MKIECKFGYLNNGRKICLTHKETLLYEYKNGVQVCCVGEDELVSQHPDKLGGYIGWINAIHTDKPQKG